MGNLSTAVIIIAIVTLIMLVVLYGLAFDFGINTGVAGAEGPPGTKGEPGIEGIVGLPGPRGPTGEIGEENPPFQEWRSGIFPVTNESTFVSFEQPFTLNTYPIQVNGTIFGTISDAAFSEANPLGFQLHSQAREGLFNYFAYMVDPLKVKRV